jgi:hypothetical protein
MSLLLQVWPAYKNQHVYYGKVNYGNWEKTYVTPTTSGTWTATANYTGADLEVSKTLFASTGRFATISQGTAAKATYTLDAALGTVDLYVFYSAEGFDSAKNAPYTVYADSVSTFPTAGGEGATIVSVAAGTDELGNANASCTTIKVDQRRVFDNSPTIGGSANAQSSGWVYIGTYTNPSKVVQTASAQVGTTSTQGFVCSNAVGVDIGKYGKSTATMSTKKFKYKTGVTSFPPELVDGAGISVIDLSTNETIDSFGEHTGPSLPDGNISSADKVE